jgi:tetratricopeptide (TPR) repeat protein
VPAKPYLPLLTSAALLLTFAVQLPAQSSSSSSSQSGTAPQEESRSTPKRPTVEAGGSAVTLETSEPLFYIASALNLCGYDDGLDASDPVRAKVRADVESAAIATPEAADSRRALCEYVHTHTLSDPGLNLAQYVSLALYTSPPPELAPTADETELPPDSTQVAGILPLLRTFAEQAHLNAIWSKYRPDYEALVDLVHNPLTRTILNTNIYLKLPASSYDGRRFLVLLEPMLAPAATNARIYGNDYTVVVSPSATPAGTVKMEQIRHTYLHYEVEPLVYSRATAMNRLQPLLRTVQEAPIEFNYKSDIVSLITECMIKAIEAHTMDAGIPKPEKTTSHERIDQERYTSEMTVYERQTEAARRNAAELSMRQGWVLTGYFYDALSQMQRDGSSLKDSIGQMVYGMDIGREAHHDQQIVFLPETPHEVVRRAPRQPTGLDLAEMKLFKGDKDGADEIAEKVLASPTGDHARANYLIARINLLDQEPDDAVTHFRAALETSRDPRTLAWCHIYLGRLYDMQQTPDRKKAVAEYHLALNLRDDRPDTKAAAEAGIRAPFAPPKREAMPDSDDNDNTPVDPTGKAEKEAYKPPPPQ